MECLLLYSNIISFTINAFAVDINLIMEKVVVRVGAKDNARNTSYF